MTGNNKVSSDLWVALLEKARAIFKNHYERLNGGQMNEAKKRPSNKSL